MMRMKIDIQWSSIILCCLVWIQANAQNTIDVRNGGGFSALVTSGGFDDSVTWTDWPEGTIYEGSVDNQSIWSTATNYLGETGSGYIHISQNADTRVFVDGSITSESEGTFNHDNDATVEFSAASSDLHITSKPGSSLANSGHAAVVYVTAADQVGITNGIFSSASINGTASTSANFAGNQHTVYISNANRAHIKNATISGSTDIANWVNNITGGTALYFGNVGNAVIDFVDDKTANMLTGGNGEIGENSNLATTPTGGAAIEVINSDLFATNLFAEGGTAGSFNGTLLRDLSAGTYGADASGGTGITSSGSDLNIYKGEIIGTDGGYFGITVQDADTWNIVHIANGGNAIDGGSGSGILNQLTASGGNGGQFKLETPSAGSYTIGLSGGDAFTGSFSGGALLNSTLIGGNGSSDIEFTSGLINVDMIGGSGLRSTSAGAGIVSNNIIFGGSGGTARVTSTGSGANQINASGGMGFYGSGVISDSNIQGGHGGNIAIYSPFTTNSVAAIGGAGAVVSGVTEINNSTITGGSGGIASANNGIFLLYGGVGVYQTNGTLTINSGTFSGGAAGAFGGSQAIASNNDGAPGILISENATIAGGTIIGSQGFDTAIRLQDSDMVTIEGNANISGNIAIHGDNASVNLLSGNASGSIDFYDGTSVLSVSNAFNFSGKINNYGGHVTTTIDHPSDGLVFNDLQIISATNIFSNGAFISGNNSKINLSGTDSFLDFQEGGFLSTGTKLDVGYGTFNSGSNLTLKENTTLSIAYDGTVNGNITLNGDLDLSATGAKILVQGNAKNSSGTIDFLTVNNVNGVEKISADLGWLTFAEVNTNTYQVSYQYQPLNGYVSGISSNLNEEVRTNNTIFSQLNSLSAFKGSQLIRFTETQTSDNADISIQNQQQVANVIAQRSSEVRAKNGFASAKKQLRLPYGLAGPSQPNIQMQGWIRGYKSSTSRDETSLFTGYDADTSGTIIGIDKRYGRLLIGLSAGITSSQINGGTTYGSSIDSTQMGIYASIGSEKSYFDFAYTQSDMDHEVNNRVLSNVNETYSATLNSFYVGVGQSIHLNKRFKITPEASLLISTYDQDAYQRSGVYAGDTKQIASYSTDSQMLSLGATLSTKNQINWSNRGLTMIPEFRFHWLRELNPDLEDMRYTSSLGSDTLSIRSREENLFKMGVGLDFWSWHFDKTKFQLNYDLTTGESYQEHLVSGKINLSF